MLLERRSPGLAPLTTTVRFSGMACSEDMTRILSIPFLGLGCVEAFPPRRHCFTGLAPLPCVLLPTRRFIAIKRSSAWPPPGTHRINKFFRLRCLTPLLPLWPLPRDTTGRSEVCVREAWVEGVNRVSCRRAERRGRRGAVTERRQVGLGRARLAT